MNFELMEQNYIHGEYGKILEFMEIIDFPLTNNISEIEKSVLTSYYSRALIRVGRISEADFFLNSYKNLNLDSNLPIFSIITLTSLINLLITQGESKGVVERFSNILLLEKNLNDSNTNYPILVEFWGSYYIYLLGIAYYYQLNYNKSIEMFHKSIKLNKTNLFIQGKANYYLAFINLELNKEEVFEDYIDIAMEIYQKIQAKQGMAWIYLWKGNLFIQKGLYEEAELKLNSARELFTIMNGNQELYLIKSLFGLISYYKGNVREAKTLLNESFTASIKLGNPMLSSYILLPFINVNIELGNRKIIEENLKIFEDFNKDSRVEFHLTLAKAIFLKSSTKFFDLAQAEKLFLDLLAKTQSESNYLFTTGDKSLKFFLTINLADIYYLEFLLSNDLKILEEIQALLDNFNETNRNENIAETIQISILKAKTLVVEGKVDSAIDELNEGRILAVQNDYIKYISQIDKELEKIQLEIDKWGSRMALSDRIRFVEMELYIKEAQKLI